MSFSVNRRWLVSGAVTGGAIAIIDQLCGIRSGSASPLTCGSSTSRVSIADYGPYLIQPPEKIRKRFELYRQIGIGTIRAGIGWRNSGAAQGRWAMPPFLLNYLRQAKEAGFRLKLTIGTVAAPPSWFLDAHPDARIKNADGEYSKDDLSPWYPGLHEILSEKADELIRQLAQSGLFELTDAVFADLGPASEPLYPAPWTLGKADCTGATPWFYDGHALAAFVSAMIVKYGAIAQANRAWHTTFDRWSDLHLPRSREYPGALWEDALLWYRDSKRNFIRWQVANYQRALEHHTTNSSVRPDLIIMVAGSHLRAEEWNSAIQSGIPDCALTTMSDTEFLLDFAEESGCWLQYTGVENEEEVRYIRQYMESNDITQPLWGENAGRAEVGRHPSRLIDVVLRANLYGLEYIDSRHLFENDTVSPNQTFRELADGLEHLHRHN